MAENKIIGSTTQCIVCLKEAKYHTGHVVKGNEDVLAGWCREHREADLYSGNGGIVYLMGKLGCYGGRHEKYGLVLDR